MNLVKSIARRALPRALWYELQKWYYPRRIRRMSPDVWLPARIVEAWLQKGDIAADVGANIGYVTYWLSRWVGADGEVHSFEPVPQTFALLSHNVTQLRLPNVRMYQVAVSDRIGQVQMEIPEWAGTGRDNLYESRVVTVSRTSAQMITVPAVVLDRVFEVTEKPLRFIKVDVEGHEWQVLRGARCVLAKWRPVLTVEVGEATAADVFAELATLGYTAFDIRMGALVSLPQPRALADIVFLQPHHLVQLASRGVRVQH